MEGNIFKLFDTKQGTSKLGKDWKAKDVVLKLKDGNFLLVTAWNDKADLFNKAKEGWDVEFEMFVKSREYANKWYTECTFTKIGFPNVFEEPQDAPPDPEPPEENDLPFR